MSIGLGINIQKKREQLAGPLREAIVDGKHPGLLLDFDDEYYLANGGKKSFDEVLTFTRSGNATMVDSDGLIKWAPHNLLTYSEDFSNAAWTKTNASIDSNVIVAPDGTVTADKLSEDSATSTHYANSALGALPIGVYKLRVYVKADGRSWFLLNIFNGTDTHNCFFDLENLTTGTETGSPDPTIVDVGNGWRLCTVTHTATVSAATNARLLLAESDGGNSYTGDGASGIYLWGAHLYRSDLGGMVDNPDRGDSYVPTTSSAVYLPRRGHHVYNGSAWVNEGLLHESEARTNSFLYSEDLSNAVWDISAGVTVTANGNLARIQFPGGSVQRIQQTISASVADQTHTVGAWVRSYNGGADQTFRFKNTHAGVLDYYSSDLTATSQWQFFSFSQAYGAGGTGTIAGIVTDSSNSAADIEVQYLQIELNAPTPSSYIPTAGATVTRAAETLTIPSANLPWPTPQVIGDELVTNGTFDGASGTTPPSSWTSDGVTLFSDVSGALRIQRNGGTGSITQDISTVPGNVYYASIDVIETTVQAARLYALGIIQADSYGSNETLAFAFVATSTTTTIGVQAANSISADITVDNISVREINPLSVSIQMEGRMTYADTNTGGSTSGKSGEVIFVEWWADSDNFIELLNTTNTGTGKLGVNQKALAAFDSVASGELFSPGILVPFNIASRHGMTFVNGAVDGVALTVNTTPTNLPDLSATDLDLAYTFMGTVERFRVWGLDLGDGGIETATEPSPEPSLSLTFDSSESSFVVDDWSA